MPKAKMNKQDSKVAFFVAALGLWSVLGERICCVVEHSANGRWVATVDGFVDAELTYSLNTVEDSLQALRAASEEAES